MTENAAPSLAEGTKIGGCYVLRRNLSKPNGSTVWLANDEVLGKDVTLHFVPASVAADSRAMSELRQEVKRNRQLIHPNILRVHDFVEDGTHVAISMDTFEGESLQDSLNKKGRLDAEDLKPWVAQLAETLADAHRIQLFHRDLSPSNLYIRPGGGLLVANFGVSRVILNSLERAGLAKGAAADLAYLSPQQIDGDRPGASDDIYGMGVLMHTLLGGKPPFSGDDMVPQIRKTVPAPISEVRAAVGASAPVPASWEKLIAGCLEKNPEARPRSLTDVLTLLGQDSGPARPRSAAVAAAVAPAVVGTGPENAAGADIPSKSVIATKGPDKVPVSEKPVASEEPVQESAASTKPLHPEIPPVVPYSGQKKSPPKGVLSANFPDLDRPRSKAPLAWLVLAAGIIGGGIYLKNRPETSEGEAKDAVELLDQAGNPKDAAVPPKPAATVGNEAASEPKAEPKSEAKVEPKAEPKAEPKSPETLPDPVPVAPPKIAEAGQQGAGDELPKAAEMSAPKQPKASGLIGGESPSVAPLPAAGAIPPTLAAASAGTAGNNPPETKPPTDAKPAGPEIIGAQSASKPPEKPATPEVQPAATPQPPAVAAQPEPLPALPAPIETLQKLKLPEKATTAQLAEIKAQREAVIANAQKAAAAAEAARQEVARRLAAAKLEKAKRQNELEVKRKTLSPAIEQAAALEADRKKLEADAAKTQAAAAEAAKQAEAAKHKLDDLLANAGDKLKVRIEAETELNTATSQVAGLAKETDMLSRFLEKADSIQEQARLTQQQAGRDLEKIVAATEKAHHSEIEAVRRANRDKIAAVEKQMPDLKAQIARYTALLDQLKELGEAGKEASQKAEEKRNAAQQQLGELENEVKRHSGEGDSLPAKDTGAVVPPVAPPVATPVPAAAEPNPPADAAPALWTNSLGMKFMPVGDVQFSVYLTTVKNFEGFAAATGLKSEAWKNPGFKQGPDYPVVNVTWHEAEAFCRWLTEKERKSGLLKAGESYRLPTDLEWSKAVGLPAEAGATPEARDMGVQDVYPWGTQWPPPAGAGNYAGEETQTEIPIPNYNDGYPNTSPVGKFRANKFGLYDMGGNVWQWVSDFWNSENRAKTLRGGSWYNGAIPLSLLSSCRISSSPDTLHDTYGFRIVKSVEAGKPKHRN